MSAKFGRTCVIVFAMLCMCGCGKSDAEDIKPSVYIETEENENSNNQIQDSSIEESSDKKSDTQAIAYEYVKEYAASVGAIAYYQDKYVPGCYLVIEPSGVTSFLYANGFTFTQNLRYDEIARTDINIVGDGFVEFTDKTGKRMSFCFEPDTTMEIQQVLSGM